MQKSQWPLKMLRESANVTQVDIAKRTGISTARLSYAENQLGKLTQQEEESVREAIISLTEERRADVLRVAGATRGEIVELMESAGAHSAKAKMRSVDPKSLVNLSESDRSNLIQALQEIEDNPSKKKFFENVRVSYGFSEHEAARFVLGEAYPHCEI